MFAFFLYWGKKLFLFWGEKAYLQKIYVTFRRNANILCIKLCNFEMNLF